MRPVSKRLRYGVPATAVTAVSLIILVLVVCLADALEQRYPLRKDLTENGAFALSGQTKDYISALSEDVSLYVLAPEQSLVSGDVYYLQANEVLRQYAAHSPRIRLEYIDLARSPEFKSRYPQYQLNSQTILLESAGRITTVNLSDLFEIEYEYLYGEEYIAASRAEQTMTGAIIGVTSQNTVTVTIAGGFGEGGTQSLEMLLTANNYTVRHRNLMLEEIGGDADIVVVCAPTRDYSEDALKKLDAFLENDGRLGRTLIYFADAFQPETPNLDAFLADWGIEVGAGVIRENDAGKRVTNSYFWSVAEYGESAFASDALRGGLSTIVPEARPISLLFTQKEDIIATQPLIFTETACIQPLDEAELDGWSVETARHGPFAALAFSTRAGLDGDAEAYSHVIAAASSLMIEQTVLENPYVGNSEYLIGMISLLSGQDAGISVAPKTIGLRYLPISEFMSVLLSGVFVVLLPLLTASAGIGAYVRRRHL